MPTVSAAKLRAGRTPMSPEPKTVPCGRPANFERLQRFFKSQAEFARALGVHRDTIRKWERGEASRLRKRSVVTVDTMAAVADQVARYMPTDASVGAWLLLPQPALRGQSPALLIQAQGKTAYARVVAVASGVAEPASVGDLTDIFADEVLARSLNEGAEGVTAGAADPDADPDFLQTLEASEELATDMNGRSVRSEVGAGPAVAPNQRIVFTRGAEWVVQRPGASRASSVHGTQRQAQEAGRRILRNHGGGELVTHGRDGQVRARDTIMPDNDLSVSRGQQH